MKTTEQIVKAISNRANQLEAFNQKLIELPDNDEDGRDIKHIYFENEARLGELYALLDYIGDENARKD